MVRARPESETLPESSRLSARRATVTASFLIKQNVNRFYDYKRATALVDAALDEIAARWKSIIASGPGLDEPGPRFAQNRRWPYQGRDE